VKGVKTGLFGGVQGGTLLGENRNRHNGVAARKVCGGRSSAAVAAPSNLRASGHLNLALTKA
ncbi:hypothetical protein, partial [uncultured Thiodictyon sp.]|uniref:hypothetical protein n=1 Tax=uncultured Thiodictyon sp. TaxID=1846217 RepID=UPI0025F249C8